MTPPPPSATSIIAGMRQTLTLPSRWTKGFSARNTLGNPVDPCSPCAVQWCLTGAMELHVHQSPDQATRDGLFQRVEEILLHVIGRELGGLAQFNDGRYTTHEEVLDLLDRAHAFSIASR